jgi:DNA polymerase-3 subunit alpha
MFPAAREAMDRFPELYQALRLEGNVKGMSTHAAGIVIANSPLSDFCAIYTQTKDGEVRQVVSLDKYDAEYLNVLKFDALGLKTMAAIRIALEHIGMTLEELYAIPLDDPETIQGFRDNDVVGVFQFDGRAMRSVNQGVVPDNFNEVADVNALARPGPLHSGATGEYIDAKHGRKKATHYHTIIDGITKHTQFQIVYQEQILQVVRELGNFSWEEAARIRKIISKKRGEQEFNRQRDKFIEGAKTHGMTRAEGDTVFSLLATAGAYAFNAAHCVSYGMLAYWTMWLKRNHPSAFYVGMLRKTSDTKDQRSRRDQLMVDLAKKHIPVEPLHMNKSGLSWTTDGVAIRPGFVQVGGVGEVTALNILSQREALGTLSGWEDVLAVKGIGPATVNTLKDFIAEEDPFGLMLLSDTLESARDRLREGLSDGPFYLPTPTHTSAEVPYDRTERDVEVTWLGVVRQRNLKDLFEAHHSRTGKVLNPASVKRPDLNEWVVMLGEDDTEPLTITVDRWKYKRFREAAWEVKLNEDLVLVRGIKRKDQARKAIYVTDMWIITEEMLSGT